MPYPSNSPRWEFSNTDRTSLANIASASLAGLGAVLTNVTIDTHYIIQITDKGRVQRSNFDAVASAINALTPTYNQTPPFPDTR